MRGHTLNSFEWDENDEGEMVLVLKDEDYLDPDYLDSESTTSITPTVGCSDDLTHLPGMQRLGINREFIEYAY